MSHLVGQKSFDATKNLKLKSTELSHKLDIAIVIVSFSKILGSLSAISFSVSFTKSISSL
jgi:hypothetical protein